MRCGSCGFGVVGSRWIERRSWGRGGAGLTALTVVVVEWSAAEQAVLDRGVPVPAEPSISLRGDDGTAPGVDSGWPELSDPAAMMNSSMYGYAAASASASRLIPFAAPPKTTNSAGVVAQVAAVAAMPGLLQRLSSAASVSWSNPNDWWLVRLLGSITPTERTTIVRLLGQSYFATGMAQFFASIAQQLTFGPGGTTAGSGGAWYPTPQFAGLGASRAVSVSLARANKIGALSVPPSWVKTTALTESPVAHAVSANPTVGSSHGPHGLLRGLPLGSRITRRSGAFAHRYGFRHSVVARPPSAG